jgi:hypothetical protein
VVLADQVKSVDWRERRAERAGSLAPRPHGLPELTMHFLLRIEPEAVQARNQFIDVVVDGEILLECGCVRAPEESRDVQRAICGRDCPVW